MVLCAYLVFSWSGGWRLIDTDTSQAALWVARAIFGLSFIASLWPLRNFTAPDKDEITRRIEVKSELEHRPITAQSDEIAMGERDGFSEILWREHKTRMSNKLQNMTAGAPSPKANRFDPFAVRSILPVLAFAAFFFSFSSVGGKLSDSYLKQESTAELLTRMDAWINPPAYTRIPPIYLSLDESEQNVKSLTVPTGSDFFLRVIGNSDIKLLRGEPTNEVLIQPEVAEKTADEIEYKFTLEEDSVIRLMHREKELGQWGIALIEDKAPEIAFFEQPKSALSGSLELGYNVKDDYGVVSARAIIQSLIEADPNARPLIDAPEVDLPLPRFRAKKGLAKANRDLTQHPWAGSKVSIQLEATDDAKQIGTTEIREITLPGRRFSKPLALAIVEQRRILALDANKRRYVANLLDAVSTAPAEYIDNANATLAMRVAYRRIVDANNDDDLRSSLDLLWEIALAVEFGDLSDAERCIARGAGKAERSIGKWLWLNKQGKILKSQNPFEQSEAQMLSQNDLERMMDQIEDLAKSGSQDAARQMLNELQRMMDNLRAGQHQQQRQAEGNQLNKSLDKLSELMQQQQRLMEESFRMQRQQQQGLRPNSGEQEQNQQRQQGQQEQGQQRQGDQQEGNQPGQQQGEESQQGQNGQMTEEEFKEALQALRQQQDALEKQLGELGQKLEELGLGQSQELEQAQREMGEAGENLGKGKPAEAGTDQGEALEALRQGAQNMMRQMAGDRQQGGEQQSQQNGQGQSSSQRSGSDPLGREEGDGLTADSDVKVPGEIDAQRARRILEAIRDRLAIPDNPLIEKDYLERLLKSE
ncbi:hypothetical protein GQR58_004312 [Nymphon striatum]|nr:hypothetical protein GQR58_004312 [Nymphon striatum]